MAQQDKHGMITDLFIEAIEGGFCEGKKWVRPWSVHGGGGAPMNPTTGREYRGINRLLLMILGCSHAAGYGQWLNVGGQVRKGSKAVVITMPMFKTDKATGEQSLIGFRLGKTFPSYTQDGWTAPPVPVVPSFELHTALDAFIADTGAMIQHGGDRACYAPSLDVITMPHAGQFSTAEDWYGTVLHELVHWTGNRTRLDRNRAHTERFDTLKDAYAFEELVAELGASFLCADMGIHAGFREDHAVYVNGWLKRLRADERAIFDAAREAQAAVEYIHNAVLSTRTPLEDEDAA